jgi:hypothetical protein
MKPQFVTIQIKPPKGEFPGQTAEGAFIVVDDVVTLTDREGAPARDAEGRTYSQKLQPGQTARPTNPRAADCPARQERAGKRL